jgi:hypothetical protein
MFKPSEVESNGKQYDERTLSQSLDSQKQSTIKMAHELYQKENSQGMKMLPLLQK